MLGGWRTIESDTECFWEWIWILVVLVVRASSSVLIRDRCAPGTITSWHNDQENSSMNGVSSKSVCASQLAAYLCTTFYSMRHLLKPAWLGNTSSHTSIRLLS